MRHEDRVRASNAKSTSTSRSNRILTVAVATTALLHASAVADRFPYRDGGPRPIIVLNQPTGQPGAIIEVSGTAPEQFAAVRIVLLTDRDGDDSPDSMRTLGVALVVDGNYTIDVEIPEDAVPGGTQIAAAVLPGFAAEFETASFIMLPASPATIEGVIEQAATDDATYLELHDRSTGEVVASTLFNPDGSFSLTDVPPGTYHFAITGSVRSPVEAAGRQVHCAPGALGQGKEETDWRTSKC